LRGWRWWEGVSIWSTGRLNIARVGKEDARSA
jgi:hypothetical protein